MRYYCGLNMCGGGNSRRLSVIRKDKLPTSDQLQSVVSVLSDIWKKNFQSANAELGDFGTLAGLDRVDNNFD